MVSVDPGGAGIPAWYELVTPRIRGERAFDYGAETRHRAPTGLRREGALRDAAPLLTRTCRYGRWIMV